MGINELQDNRVFFAVHEPGDGTRYEFYVILSYYSITVAGKLGTASLPRKVWETHLPDIKAMARDEALSYHFTTYITEQIPNPYTALAAIEVVAEALGIA